MKKILVLALFLVLLASLTACGSKTDPAPSGGTTDPGASQQQPSDTPDNSGDNIVDETFFIDTDTKGVIDAGDHYRICYHEGDTITGLEEWYEIDEGASAKGLISLLEEIYAEDDYITKIYQNGNYVVVEYSAKDYFTVETWEQIKQMYD